jgi:hypothetical protein
MATIRQCKVFNRNILSVSHSHKKCKSNRLFIEETAIVVTEIIHVLCPLVSIVCSCENVQSKVLTCVSR